MTKKSHSFDIFHTNAFLCKITKTCRNKSERKYQSKEERKEMERLPKELLIKIIQSLKEKIDKEYKEKYIEICRLLKRTAADSYSYHKLNCIECRRLSYERKEGEEKEWNWCITTVPENADYYPHLEFESVAPLSGHVPKKNFAEQSFEKENGGILVRSEYYCHKHNLSLSKQNKNKKQKLHQLPKGKIFKILQIVDSEETKKWENKINVALKYLRRTCKENSMFSLEYSVYEKDGKQYEEYDILDSYTDTFIYLKN